MNFSSLPADIVDIIVSLSSIRSRVNLSKVNRLLYNSVSLSISKFNYNIDIQISNVNAKHYVERNKFYLDEGENGVTLLIDNEKIIYYEKVLGPYDNYHHVVTVRNNMYILRIYLEYYDDDNECAWLKSMNEFTSISELLNKYSKYAGTYLTKLFANFLIDCEEGQTVNLPLPHPKEYEYCNIGGKLFKLLSPDKNHANNRVYDYHCILYIENGHESQFHSIYRMQL